MAGGHRVALLCRNCKLVRFEQEVADKITDGRTDGRTEGQYADRTNERMNQQTDGRCSNVSFAPALNEPLRNNKLSAEDCSLADG